MMNGHHLADLLPAMAQSDYDALKDDIAKHGLRESVWTYEGQILDGRHRYKACSELGVECRLRPYEGDDPHGFVVSMNIHRRHLTTPQRRELIAALLKATPMKSDRDIAETARSSHHTVAQVRTKLETGGQIAHHAKRVGRDGKEQAATKDAGLTKQQIARRNAKPREQRVQEIRALTAEGNNVEQIADKFGIDVGRVRKIINESHIEVAPHTMSKRGSRGNVPTAARVIEETVNHLTGCVQGLRLIRGQPLNMTAERAAELWREARDAMKAINAVLDKLREVAHG